MRHLKSLINRKNTKFILKLGILFILALVIGFSQSDKNSPQQNTNAPILIGAVRIFNSSATISATNMTYEGDDIEIRRGTVTIAGHHRFNSLKITGNSILTHPYFSSTDTISSDKKVSLEIAGDVTLDDGGKIDVSQRGYRGGTAGSNGTGPGPGIGALTNSWFYYASAGGGAFIGRGGAGSLPITGAGGTPYAQSASIPDINPLKLGSGGGSAKKSSSTANGGSGGGRIDLRVGGDIRILSTTSGIFASGRDGTQIGRAYSGAGAGGSIWLSANQFFYPYGTMISAGANAGTGGTGAANGTFIKPAGTFYNITANGGAGGAGHGGGGGGGYIYIDPSVSIGEKACVFMSGATSIPAECENQDVVIDGATIDAGAVKVWPTAGTHLECKNSIGLYNFVNIRRSDNKCRYRWFLDDKYEDALPVAHSTGQNCEIGTAPGWGRVDARSDTACDSRRNFLGLTVRSNGVLTHDALAIADMAQDSDGDHSLSDETAGTARWKKVDIVTVGGITLKSNGTINVDGKGYPGGQADGQNGYGPSGGEAVHFVGNRNDYTKAGGGGSYGAGGTPEQGDTWGYGGPAYPSSVIDYGSGGGFAYAEDRGGGSCNNKVADALGGNGGGRISLETQHSIILSNGSYVTANGTFGESEHHKSGQVGCGKVEAWAYGGGGGGGLIQFGGRIVYSDLMIPLATVFGGAANGFDGIGPGYPILGLFANGEHGGDNRGGGGGGGKISIHSGQLHVTVVNSKGDRINTQLTVLRPDFPPAFGHTGTPPPTPSPDPLKGEYTFNLPISGDPPDCYSVTANPDPAGYQTKTVTYASIAPDQPVPCPIEFNRYYDLTIIVEPFPSYITGDVAAHNDVKLGSFKVETNSIVAGRNISPSNVCRTAGTCKILSGYTIDWTKFNTTLTQNLNNLKTEKAYQYRPTNPIKTSLLPLGPGTIIPNWNLNSNTGIPTSSGSRYPEGGIWYIVNSDGSPRDLVIANLRYSGYGTIIVSRNLTINGSVSSADPKKNGLGFIVGGSVTINRSSNTIQAAIYSSNNAVIQDNRTSALDFEGFLAARNNITLPYIGNNSTLKYNSYLSNNSSKRALPGFSNIQSVFLSNVAP